MAKPHLFNYIVESAGYDQRLPERWRPRLVNQFYQKSKSKGYYAAEVELIETINNTDVNKFLLGSDDDSICSFAKARAAECFRTLALFKSRTLAVMTLIKIPLRYEIQIYFNPNVTFDGLISRLIDEKWWRRQLRKAAARNVEHAAIKIGMVSRVEGLYCSDEAVKRRRGQRNRNHRILSSIDATNDLNQTFTLQELADLGVSNKEIRRMELMTRLNGFDEIAQDLDHAAEFYTITAPSKYHARHHVTGKVNQNYSGATPRQTQAYLVDVWAKVRAKLGNMGINVYGIRVCEPHHDATPHWHLLLFCEKHHVKTIRRVIKHYVMREDTNERGAHQHRFKAERIDRRKGSAVAYLAKYISKNIDGHEVGPDFESKNHEDAASTADRVDAWASTWGIRQFQQIGGQAVTIWRELRRAELADIENERFRMIAEAADSGSWRRFTLLNGGISPRVRLVDLDKVGAIDMQTGEISLNQYNEPAADKIIGVTYRGEVVRTRQRTWVFERRVSGAPRTRVNNCTEAVSKERQRQETAFRKSREEEKPAICLLKNDFFNVKRGSRWAMMSR